MKTVIQKHYLEHRSVVDAMDTYKLMEHCGEGTYKTKTSRPSFQWTPKHTNKIIVLAQALWQASHSRLVITFVIMWRNGKRQVTKTLAKVICLQLYTLQPTGAQIAMHLFNINNRHCWYVSVRKNIRLNLPAPSLSSCWLMVFGAPVRATCTRVSGHNQSFTQ